MHQQLRFLIYTLGLILFLKGCTPVLNAQEAPPSIKIEVSPRIQLLPMGYQGTVAIRVTVPRRAENRAVCVIVEGPLSRSSCWEHDATGAYRKEFRYSGLPAGEYEVVGVLEWVKEGESGRKTTVARDRFVITEGGASDF